GRFLALSDAATASDTTHPAHVMVVKMTTPTVAQVSELPNPTLFKHTGRVGWISITPDARELVVKYAADTVSGASNDDDCIRVFDLDTDSTSATYLQVKYPHPFCGTFSTGNVTVPVCPPVGCAIDSLGRPLDPSVGWVHPLKHPDMMRDGTSSVLVGINTCSGETNQLGRILKVDLYTGALTSLTSPSSSCLGSTQPP